MKNWSVYQMNTINPDLKYMWHHRRARPKVKADTTIEWNVVYAELGEESSYDQS